MNIVEQTVEKSIREFAEGKQINLDAETARVELAKVIIADLSNLAVKLDGAVEKIHGKT
jgi:hypothetical protein